MGIIHPAHSGLPLGKREYLVYDGMDSMLSDECYHGLKVLGTSHGGTKNI